MKLLSVSALIVACSLFGGEALTMQVPLHKKAEMLAERHTTSNGDTDDASVAQYLNVTVVQRSGARCTQNKPMTQAGENAEDCMNFCLARDDTSHTWFSYATRGTTIPRYCWCARPTAQCDQVSNQLGPRTKLDIFQIVQATTTTTTTTTTVVQTATITGDPHMQNVRGVKQDLLSPGTYNILQLPLGKGDSLTLIGDVSYIDHPTFCNPLFLTKLRIIGTALGNQEFKFDLGNSSDAQSFSVTRTNLRTQKSGIFQVSEPIEKQFGLVALSTAQCKKGQVGENSKNCWDNFNTMVLKLSGKDGNFLTLNVRRGGQLGFFDVKATGLDALGMSVGGLLGTNGFTSLGTSTDKTCHNKRRSKLKALMEIHQDHVHIEQSLLMANM